MFTRALFLLALLSRLRVNPAAAQSLPTQAYVPPALAAEAVVKAAVPPVLCRKRPSPLAVLDRYGTTTYSEQNKDAAADAAQQTAAEKRKASTARLSGQSSADYAKNQHSRPGGPGTGQVQYPAIILAGGGLPIKTGEGKTAETVAAIGVSGSASEQMDEDCARAGLTKMRGDKSRIAAAATISAAALGAGGL